VNDVHGVKKMRMICPVKAQKSRLFSHEVSSRLVGTCDKALNNGTEIGVHERSKSPILKYTNIQNTVFRFSFLIKYKYIMGSKGVKLISHLGDEGTQSKEKIVTKRKHITKHLKKQPKKSFLICVQQLVWTPN
jgi:hypothetical protein